MATYPHEEIYLGIDCGSGHEFVFPHPSAADMDGPNKLLDNQTTVPMKVCNGIVHGDQTSYVILRPGVVGATSNHNIECINMIVNDIYKRWGKLPPRFTMQCDGATTNKSIVVRAFLGLYVLEEVFTETRLRTEIEHHAHDIYDQAQSVHAPVVKRSTYWTHEELSSILKGAHRVDGDGPRSLRPLVGQNLSVLNLFEARDFWEWLTPGYTDTKTRARALSNGACQFHQPAQFPRLQHAA